MGVDGHIDWRAAAASALEWWHDAGVNSLASEDARDWLAAPAPAAAPLPLLPTPAIRALADSAALTAEADALPDTAEAFIAWRLSDAAPDAAWPGGRCFVEGPADAPLAVLTDMPGADGLIGGDAGILFDRMLAAIGLDRDRVHLVSLCAAPPLAGRVPPGLADALGRAARHYLGLVRPPRLLLLGKEAAEAVLGANGSQLRGRLQQVNHDGSSSRTVASFHPQFLLKKPGAKALAWADLQLLIGEDA